WWREVVDPESPRIKSAVKRLLKVCKLEDPVTVSFDLVSNTSSAECSWTDGAFQIRVHYDVSEDHAIDLLIHEFAHAVDWYHLGVRDPHGPSFGLAWAEVHRKFY